MKAHIVERTTSGDGRVGKRFRIDDKDNKPLVDCKTKKAARNVVKALSNPAVLWRA
ncbi:MAG: hypothetical protein MUP81_03240 [Dehalococcoidia bacterium]|nr:hypothetical protein [Dehalococcoidia bacterium]